MGGGWWQLWTSGGGDCEQLGVAVDGGCGHQLSSGCGGWCSAVVVVWWLCGGWWHPVQLGGGRAVCLAVGSRLGGGGWRLRGHHWRVASGGDRWRVTGLSRVAWPLSLLYSALWGCWQVAGCGGWYHLTFSSTTKWIARGVESGS